MLTLDATVNIPSSVLFTTVEGDVVLLNTVTSQYFALDEVGARFWTLLTEGKTPRKAQEMLLEEFAVEPVELEKDLLELIEDLQENGLVEIAEA